MTVTNKAGQIIFLFFCITGCASYPTSFPSYQDATGHYQGTDRFNEIALDVRVVSRDEALDSATARAATVYLEQNNISVVPSPADGGGAVATLSLLIGKRGNNYVINSKLFAPDGSVVEETPLFLAAPELEGDALAQHLATLAVDDLLLLWYPAQSGGGSSTASPAKFTLLTNDMPRQSIGGDTTLSWEEFPSKRLLKNSGLPASDIRNVTYELRIHKAGQMYGAFHRYSRTLVYRQSGIPQPEFTLPFALPSCEKIVWSVRARFELSGHLRVTEWSGHYSTAYNGFGPLPIYPPYVHRRSVEQENWGRGLRSFPMDHHAGGGSMEKVVPPRTVKCGKLHRGVSSGWPSEFFKPINSPLWESD